MKKLIGLVILTIMATQVQAAGFRVALQSAKQTGMAHVGVGMNLGPESIFFNPGALAHSDRGGISFTGSAVMSTTTYNLPGTAVTSELEDNIGTPIALYASHKFSDKLAGGLGIYTPYGNRVEWENDWAGRFISQSIDLKAFFIQPTLSYKLSDKIGIGAGLIYAAGTVELQRAVPITNEIEPDLLLETDGAASGIGYNAGIYLQASENVSLGVDYRSKIEVDAEDGTITKLNFPDAQAVNSVFTATAFNATLPLPAELAFGGAVKANDRLTIAADANLIFWNAYESLDFEFNGTVGGEMSSINPQNWEDAWTIKLGGQYAASDKIDLRAGAYLDYTPIPDATLTPITPDSDRLNFSFGGTVRPSDQFSIDAALLIVNGEERTVEQSESVYDFAQRYRVGAVVPSLGLNYGFNK